MLFAPLPTALLGLLDQQLLDHPLPWRIEEDWTFEVTASDGEVIAKFPSRQFAASLIQFAEKHQAKRRREFAKVEREMLKDTG